MLRRARVWYSWRRLTRVGDDSKSTDAVNRTDAKTAKRNQKIEEGLTTDRHRLSRERDVRKIQITADLCPMQGARYDHHGRTVKSASELNSWGTASLRPIHSVFNSPVP